jgi:hypothetical protein
MTACRQPGCTGTIVDGYCDVCGSPASAAPFVSAAAAASVTSPAPADEPGLTAVPASTPAPAPVDEGIPTLFDLRWSPETTDSIDIQGSREVEATLRRLIEPAVADVEAADTAEVERPVADVEAADTAEVEPPVADVEDADTAEVEPPAPEIEKADTAPAGLQQDDTVEMPGVPAPFSRGRHLLPGWRAASPSLLAEARPQPPEQQVLGPEPVQGPANKKRFGSLALAATILAALLIGALFFANRDVGGVAAQSDATVTATATMPVSKQPSARSDESTDTGRGESIIQLEDLAASARPFEAVRIQGTYRGGAGTFLRVQRWDGGKWLDFPLPTKTDQSGRFITQAEFGQPGRYRLRVLDPDSGVTSETFVVMIRG